MSGNPEFSIKTRSFPPPKAGAGAVHRIQIAGDPQSIQQLKGAIAYRRLLGTDVSEEKETTLEGRTVVTYVAPSKARMLEVADKIDRFLPTFQKQLRLKPSAPLGSQEVVMREVEERTEEVEEGKKGGTAMRSPGSVTEAGPEEKTDQSVELGEEFEEFVPSEMAEGFAAEGRLKQDTMNALWRCLLKGLERGLPGCGELAVFQAQLQFACNRISGLKSFVSKLSKLETGGMTEKAFKELMVDILEAFLKTPEGQHFLVHATQYEEVDAVLKEVNQFLSGLAFTKVGTMLRKGMLDSLQAAKKTWEDRKSALSQEVTNSFGRLSQAASQWARSSRQARFLQEKWGDVGSLKQGAIPRLVSNRKGTVLGTAVVYKKGEEGFSKAPEEEELCTKAVAESICSTRVGQQGLAIAASGAFPEMARDMKERVIKKLEAKGWERVEMMPPFDRLEIVETSSLQVYAVSQQLLGFKRSGQSSPHQVQFKSEVEASLDMSSGLRVRRLEAGNQVFPSSSSEEASQIAFMSDYQEALKAVQAEYVEDSLGM